MTQKNEMSARTLAMEELEKVNGGERDSQGRRVKFIHGRPYYL